MNDYPRMLYRKGASDSPELHGFHCDTMVADDADAEAAVAGEGWRRTPAEAHGKEPESAIPDTPEARELQDERNGLLQEVEDLKSANANLSARVGELTNNLAAVTKERDEINSQIAELTAPAKPAKGEKA